eukprot:234524-Rhodomonas_salina.3
MQKGFQQCFLTSTVTGKNHVACDVTWVAKDTFLEDDEGVHRVVGASGLQSREQSGHGQVQNLRKPGALPPKNGAGLGEHLRSEAR